jgi:DNA modification methylase
MDEQLKQTLEQINWDFSEYNSAKYPLDINSIHWYLASFPPPIPMYLISLLSKESDIIFDPFGGAGTTAIEALSLNRKFIYNELNPFAVDILKSKITILQRSATAPNFLNNEENLIKQYLLQENKTFINSHKISEEVIKWYHDTTLTELCTIINLLHNSPDADESDSLIRWCAFSSILKAVCSQTDHITYVTDNCWPKNLIYKNAIKLYINQINLFRLSAIEFHKRYAAFFSNGSDLFARIDQSIIHSGDSRKMPWLEDLSVDLVITSPPYLCAQDYIKTMRLTNMFFQNQEITQKMQFEIGPRRKRGSDADKTVKEYYSDMDSVFSEIYRVLRPDKYFCLIIGRGSVKKMLQFDIIGDIKQNLQNKYNFRLEYEAKRNIWSRRIHIGGVSEEHILIFRKTDNAR